MTGYPMTLEESLFRFMMLYIVEITVLTLLYGIFPKFKNGKNYIYLTIFLLTSPFLLMLPEVIANYNRPQSWNLIQYLFLASFYAIGGYLYGKFYHQMILPRFKRKKEEKPKN